PGAPDLDQIGPLMRHDAAGRTGRQHEAVRLLGGDHGPVQPEAADAARLENGIARTGYHDRLAEPGTTLDVPRLLQQIGAHPAGGLAEELRDVQYPELGRGAKPRGELDPGDVQRGPRRRGGAQL